MVSVPVERRAATMVPARFGANRQSLPGKEMLVEQPAARDGRDSGVAPLAPSPIRPIALSPAHRRRAANQMVTALRNRTAAATWKPMA